MRIAIISTMGSLPWGGSEKLWSEMADRALDKGHEVAISTFDWPDAVSEVDRLAKRGAQVFRRPRRRFGRGGRVATLFHSLQRWLRSIRPNVVLISQGATHDCAAGGYDVGGIWNFLGAQGTPYVVVCQFNGESDALSESIRRNGREFFRKAVTVGFVAERNLRTAERQLGTKLENGRVLRNPVNVRDRSIVAWQERETAELACVARLELAYKGQDILLEALAGEPWASRNWRLRFYGDGPDLAHIKHLIDYYNLKGRASLEGFKGDIREIWADNHMLVLPSHAEGTPLAMVEAMICGRSALVTAVGGNEEWITDESIGIVAPAASVTSLRSALERAWRVRGAWREMGERAHTQAISLLDADPAATLLEVVLAANTRQK